MSTITMKELTMHTLEGFPQVGQATPDFALTDTDLSIKTLEDFKDKTILFNVYPSIDTQVCFNSVKEFNKQSSTNKDLIIACVSMDLPFALKRIGEAEDLKHIKLFSDFRNRDFGNRYGLSIADGPLAGLLARAVIIVGPDQKVKYTELVNDISNPPNYDEALKHIG